MEHFFSPHCPYGMNLHTHALITNSLSFSLSLARSLCARCCQGHWAAGEAAGVRWRPRSQAPVSEEGPSERVLHSHQRGESPSGKEPLVREHKPDSCLLILFLLWDFFFLVYFIWMTFLMLAVLAVVFFSSAPTVNHCAHCCVVFPHCFYWWYWTITDCCTSK